MPVCHLSHIQHCPVAGHVRDFIYIDPEAGNAVKDDDPLQVEQTLRLSLPLFDGVPRDSDAGCCADARNTVCF